MRGENQEFSLETLAETSTRCQCMGRQETPQLRRLKKKKKNYSLKFTNERHLRIIYELILTLEILQLRFTKVINSKVISKFILNEFQLCDRY